MVSCANKHGIFRLKNGRIEHLTKSSCPRVIFGDDHSWKCVKPTNTASVSYIKVNDSGNLLAIAAEDRVTVWSIGKTPSTNIATVKLESFVRGLEWHPAAKDDAGLVIVTENRVTSVFCNPLWPSDVERLEIIDEDNLKIDIGSIAFGSSDSPLGIASLYISSRDGDLYRLSPFIPTYAALFPEQLNDLKRDFKPDDLVAVYDGWCNIRNKFVKYVARRKQPGSSVTATNICRSEPVSALKLKPYPDVLYEEDSLDIRGGSIGWFADAVVQLTQNFLNFYIALSNVNGGELCLVSSLRFRDAQKQRNIAFFESGLVITNEGDDSASQIFDFSQLLNAWHESGQFIENGEKLIKITSLGEDELPYITIDGSVCLLSALGKLVRELPKSAKGEEMNDLIEAVSTVQIDEAKTVLYSDPDYFSTTLNDLTAKIQPYKSLTPGLVFADNAQSLVELSDISTHYQKQLASLHKLMVKDDYARQARERDIASQISALQKISDLVEKTTKVNQSKSHSTVLEISERNCSFKERIEHIKQKLDTAAINQQGGFYSKSEQTWYQELTNKLPAALDQQAGTLMQLRQRLAQLKEPSTIRGNRPQFAKSRIFDAQQKLREQSLALDMLRAKAEYTTPKV